MCKFSKSDRAKLGNTVVYISNKVQHLHKTKLLKLLYLMEESMVKAYHVPFLAIPYETWKLGPVQKDVFVEISDGAKDLLAEYISVNSDEEIVARAAFDDSEFSDAEIGMMNSVLKKYGKCSAEQLVDLLHQKDGLWYQTASAHGLIEAFNDNLENNSDVRLEFSNLLSGCERDFYEETLSVKLNARMMRSEAHV